MKREKIELVLGLLVVIIVLAMIGGLVKQKLNENKEKTPTVNDDFLKIPEYTTDLSEYNNSYPTTITDDDNSYWFVVVQDQGGFSTMRNTFIKQPHRWFSYEEAKGEFEKDCFILNIVRVDKETYEHNNNN